jgi:hypothetical protein
MLNKYISSNEKSYGSLLDERANAEINEQERLVAEQTSYNDNGNN